MPKLTAFHHSAPATTLPAQAPAFDPPDPFVVHPPHHDPWRPARVVGDVIVLAAVVAPTGGASRGWALGLAAVLLAVLAIHEASTRALRSRPGGELSLVARVVSLTTLATSGVALVAGAGDGIVAGVVVTGLVAGGALGLSRAGLALAQQTARRRHGPRRPTLIVGAGRIGRLTAQRLLDEPALGLRPVGFLDKEPLAAPSEGPSLPVFGASWDLERTVAEQGIEVVVVAFSTAPNHVPLSIVRRCWELGVAVVLIPRLFEVQGTRVISEHMGGLPLVTLNPANPEGWQLRVKYALDRVIALVLLAVLAPVLIAIAAAIRLTMGAPVLFRQPRLGRDDKRFEMLKFRTMWGAPEAAGENDARWAVRAAAEKSPVAAANGDAHPAGHAQVNGHVAGPADGHGGAAGSVNVNGHAPVAAKVACQDRRTPLGRALRRFSLDELPQLWNVARGDMSLVGPRPERLSYAGEFEKTVYRYRDRARIKPGLTGWAQVNGLRGETSLADRVEWDNFYIENWSPWLDLKILARTLLVASDGDS